MQKKLQGCINIPNIFEENLVLRPYWYSEEFIIGKRICDKTLFNKKILNNLLLQIYKISDMSFNKVKLKDICGISNYILNGKNEKELFSKYSNTDIYINLSHCDIQLKNIIRKKDKIFLIDWDKADEKVCLYDLFYFIIRTFIAHSKLYMKYSQNKKMNLYKSLIQLSNEKCNEIFKNDDLLKIYLIIYLNNRMKELGYDEKELKKNKEYINIFYNDLKKYCNL